MRLKPFALQVESTLTENMSSIDAANLEDRQTDTSYYFKGRIRNFGYHVSVNWIIMHKLIVSILYSYHRVV